MLAQILILGGVHYAIIYQWHKEEKYSPRKQLLARDLKLASKLTRNALEKFVPDWIFKEARPIPGRPQLTSAQLPPGMRFHYIEPVHDPDILSENYRELNMALRLGQFVFARPSRRTALLCGASHAVPIGKHLAKMCSGKIKLRCRIEYVIPPFLKRFPEYHNYHGVRLQA